MRLIAERTGRHCLSLPSNRLGLYLALRHWCLPGQRLLMSPISADEILFLVLAAGLRPVIAPLNPRDGNIDVSRADLSTVDAVLTTNLYGLPDQVSAFAGKILIEDVAHALETAPGGRPLGTFGQAGVFSLSKHPGAGSGGVLAVTDRADLEALERARDELLVPGALRADLVSVATSMARQAALRLGLVRPALALMRALGMQEEREGYRIALEADALELALKQVPALPPFDPWVRADLAPYRARRGRLVGWYQSRRLAKVPGERARRLAGIARLAELPTVAPAVLDNLDQPLFRVPLLVRDRDAAVAELERRGVATGYLYDPPYDDYAPGFTDASPDPGPARWWARHVLPVDPVYVSRSLPVLRTLEPPTRGPREPA
ncbi:DegT/DnrJ/EryC1/StrS family aminotransferase [Nonomuraea sp. NPDC049607]|uniref:DegT/DnrJ/EryC1/StrS family aminotransferase n=1 Tax=Nonomuraea sp. NPDC049607 TaxID=3154732 RepID=UPI00344A1942